MKNGLRVRQARRGSSNAFWAFGHLHSIGLEPFYECFRGLFVCETNDEYTDLSSLDGLVSDSVPERKLLGANGWLARLWCR